MRSHTLSFPLVRDRAGGLAAGILLSLLAASVAIAAGRLPWCRDHGIGVLTLAIIIGIVFGNTWYARVAAVADGGVQFTRQTVLRTGIVLYGFRVSFADLAQVGLAGAAIDALMVASTFGIAAWVGVRMLKLDRNTALLIGAGNAICGAAAVMATEPVLKARSEQAAVAVGTVVLFGSLAMFAYPVLYGVLHVLGEGVSAHAFGIYAGSTIHEVAQVVAAARSLGEEAAHAAVVTKMMRVMMLAPFLMMLSFALGRRAPAQADGDVSAPRIAVPWFAFLFVAVIALHSVISMPAAALQAIAGIDDVLLAMAMAALGFVTRLDAMRRAGGKSLALAGLLFVWLTLGGGMVNWLLLRY